jgi:hypothetical protein
VASRACNSLPTVYPLRIYCAVARSQWSVHDPGQDYDRFSEDSYRDVIMAGLEHVEIWHIMLPPRVFALGRKGLGRSPACSDATRARASDASGHVPYAESRHLSRARPARFDDPSPRLDPLT